ncbi:MAG: NADH-quinone oxidoreductase subunit J [Acidobacteriota bacterium]
MNLYNFFTFLFVFMTLIFSIGVITRKNAIHSAVFLIFTILSIAGLFFLLGAEFIGAVQILVYAGGIMVIYLFIIMLIRLEEVGGKARSKTLLFLTGFLFLLLFLEIIYLLLSKDMPAYFSSPEPIVDNVRVLGNVLLKDYVIPFEIASLLLLVAMIATIYLARRKIQ